MALPHAWVAWWPDDLTLFAPGAKGFLHLWVSEEGETLFMLDGAFDDAGHVGTLGHFACGDLDLAAELVGVGDSGAVDDAIEAGPEGVCHAHWAGLAGGVEGVALERKTFEFFAGEADGADLGVGAGIILFADSVGGAHEAFAGLGMEDVCAEGDGVIGLQGTGCPGGEVAHTFCVKRCLSSVHLGSLGSHSRR